MKDKNLVGGFQFEPKKDGTPRRQTPVRASKSALTALQALKEDDHLIKYWAWIRQWASRYPQLTGELPGHERGRLAFHVENERQLDPSKRVQRRNPKTGATYYINLAGMRRRNKGVVKGVADVFHLVPSNGYCYMVADLKVRDATPEPEQLEFMEQARRVGAFGHFAWCWPELARLTMYYYGIKDLMMYAAADDPARYIVPLHGGHDTRCGCGMKIDELISCRRSIVTLAAI